MNGVRGPVQVCLVTGLSILLASCTRPPQLPYYSDAQLTPQFIRASSPRINHLHRIQDFALTDQQGRTITSSSVAGKTYVASFFYTSCKQICPKLKTNLTRVQEAYANDPRVLILSHTVVPEMDSEAVLARYARTNSLRNDKWLLLRGERTAIKSLATRSYFVELDDTTGNTDGNLVHTEVLVLVDKDRHIRGVYDGTLPFEVSRLIEDVRLLLNAS